MTNRLRLIVVAGVIDIVLYSTLGYLAYHYVTCPVV